MITGIEWIDNMFNKKNNYETAENRFSELPGYLSEMADKMSIDALEIAKREDSYEDFVPSYMKRLRALNERLYGKKRTVEAGDDEETIPITLGQYTADQIKQVLNIAGVTYKSIPEKTINLIDDESFSGKIKTNALVPLLYGINESSKWVNFIPEDGYSTLILELETERKERIKLNLAELEVTMYKDDALISFGLEGDVGDKYKSNFDLKEATSIDEKIKSKIEEPKNVPIPPADRWNVESNN